MLVTVFDVRIRVCVWSVMGGVFWRGDDVWECVQVGIMRRRGVMLEV